MQTYNQKLSEMNKQTPNRTVKYLGKERTYFFSNLEKTVAKITVGGKSVYGKVMNNRFIKNRTK